MKDVGNQIKGELKNAIEQQLQRISKRRLEMANTLQQWTDRLACDHNCINKC